MTKYQNLKNFAKELFRLALFSLPAALILLLTQNPEVAGIYGVPILFVLRAVDKAINENKNTDLKGLSPL